ncbi:MAG: choice-of-anchor U domain-containing protein [bacterium]
MRNKITFLVCLVLAAVTSIVFPSQSMAGFGSHHLIQVIYRDGDNEVGVDLGDIEDPNISKKDNLLVKSGEGFKINYLNNNSWENVYLGIFSYSKNESGEFAYFITTKPTEPSINQKSFTSFMNAYKTTVLNYYGLREVTHLSDRLVQGIAQHSCSYWTKMDSQSAPGQYAGLLKQLDGIIGEKHLGETPGQILVTDGFDFDTGPNPYFDVYLYKVKKTGSQTAVIIPGENTPYVATIRIYADGCTVMNPYVPLTLTLTLTINGQGSVRLGHPLNQTYTQNTAINLLEGTRFDLEAIAAEGWTFEVWGGGLEGISIPATTLEMDMHKEVIASFRENTLDNQCWGGDFDNDGDVDGKDLVKYRNCKADLNGDGKLDDEDAALFALSFGRTGCPDNSTPPPFNQYIASVTTEGNGKVLENQISCDEIELTAQPDSGWAFTGWSGDLSGTDSSATLTMNGHKSITAIFVKLPYKLTIRVEGRGTVTPIEGTYFDTATVMLTAAPDSGYQIHSWCGTDNDATTANTNAVTVSGNRLVTVKFSPIPVLNFDGDFVPDDEEKGPGKDNPNYDGNGDGIADYRQENVASMYTWDDQYYVTLASPTLIQSPEMMAVDLNSLAEGYPPGVNIFCLFQLNFPLGNLNTDGSTTVTLYLPAGVTPNTYYKYGPTSDNPKPHWYEFLYDGQTGAQIQGNIVTLHFIDGARGDDDLSANGEIIDIGGPATVPGTSSKGSGSGGCFVTILKKLMKN